MKKLLLSLVAILFAINAYAQPNTITYQGVLTDNSGALITGTPNITFALYDALENGNQLWTETQNAVSVANGLFQVELGSVTAFGSLNFAQDMWLQITVDGTTLTPRVKLNANGYSFRSTQAISAISATSSTTATSATTATNIAGGGNGSIPYQSASGTTTMLAAGTNGHVLTLAGGVPTWAAPGGGVNPSVVGFGTKTVAETRNNTDVLSDDAALFTNWGLGNAGTYLVEFVLAIRIDFLPPANSTGGGIDIAIDKIGAGNVSFSAISSMDAYQIWAQLGDRKNIFCYNCGYNDGTYFSTTIRAVVTIDNNVSGVKLRWAQQSGRAINANSYIGARSYVYYNKLQ